MGWKPDFRIGCREPAIVPPTPAKRCENLHAVRFGGDACAYHAPPERYRLSLPEGNYSSTEKYSLTECLDRAIWDAATQQMESTMPALQGIEVDWDIYKMIQTERRSFDEPDYVALRRLLKLPAPKASPEPATEPGLPWVEDGVEVPHGSLARMEYLRGSQVYEGRFLNGKIVVNGKSFDSLSAAASALATTRDGSKPSLNGWLYWKAKFPGEADWRSLGAMREFEAKILVPVTDLSKQPTSFPLDLAHDSRLNAAMAAHQCRRIPRRDAAETGGPASQPTCRLCHGHVGSLRA